VEKVQKELKKKLTEASEKVSNCKYMNNEGLLHLIRDEAPNYLSKANKDELFDNVNKICENALIHFASSLTPEGMELLVERYHQKNPPQHDANKNSSATTTKKQKIEPEATTQEQEDVGTPWLLNLTLLPEQEIHQNVLQGASNLKTNEHHIVFIIEADKVREVTNNLKTPAATPKESPLLEIVRNLRLYLQRFDEIDNEKSIKGSKYVVIGFNLLKPKETKAHLYNQNGGYKGLLSIAAPNQEYFDEGLDENFQMTAEYKTPLLNILRPNTPTAKNQRRRS
jgi:hypothetical protein